MPSTEATEPNQTDKWRPAHDVRTSLIVHARCETGGGFVRGSVKTPYGIVDVHSQGLHYVGPMPLEQAEGALQSTTLSIIIAGREKERVIDAAYSEIRLKKIARDFAREAARQVDRNKERQQANG